MWDIELALLVVSIPLPDSVEDDWLAKSVKSALKELNVENPGVRPRPPLRPSARASTPRPLPSLRASDHPVIRPSAHRAQLPAPASAVELDLSIPPPEVGQALMEDLNTARSVRRRRNRYDL